MYPVKRNHNVQLENVNGARNNGLTELHELYILTFSVLCNVGPVLPKLTDLEFN